MSLELGPANTPDLIAGLGMLAIAALLLWVAPTNRVHRAFALFQVANAGGSLTFALYVGFERTDPVLFAVLQNVGYYFILSWPFAAGFFALRFLDPEGRSRASRAIALGLLVGVVGALGVFALDHGLYLSGPLGFVMWFSIPLTFGSIALLFAIAARRAEGASRRDGLVLSSLAFLLLAAYQSAARLSIGLLVPPGTTQPMTSLLAGSIGALLVLASVGTILGVPPLRGDPATRRSRRLIGVGAALSGLSAFAGIWMFAQDPIVSQRLPSTLDGVWRIVMTVVLAYALLKRQVFDVEVKLRFAISRSTVAAVFIAVFFFVSEAAQQFFGETSGSAYLGIAAAGALVFAIAPLQRVADRFAHAAVPGRTARPSAEPLALYRTALEMAMTDGTVTREEERKLAQIAHDLGLSPLETLQVRESVDDRGGKEVR